MLAAVINDDSGQIFCSIDLVVFYLLPKTVRACVLSGGAVKGAWQVGALRAMMFDNEQDYDLVCGVSVGALNGAIICQERKGNPQVAWLRLMKTWESIDNSLIKREWSIFGRIAGMWKQSLYDARPLQRAIADRIDMKKLRATDKILKIGAVDADTGQYINVGPGSDEFIEWLYASASFPSVFQPAVIGERTLMDGGIKNMVPIITALEMGADEIDVYIADHGIEVPWNKKRTALSCAARAIEIISNEMISREISIVNLMNSLALENRKSPVVLNIFRPSKRLLLDHEGSFDFSCKTIARLIEMGYNDAMDHMAANQ